MVTVCADASGNILQIVSDPRLDAPVVAGPSGTVWTVPIDERTNAITLAPLLASTNGYMVSGSVSGSILLSSGTPVPINPPSLARLDRLALVNIWQTLKADQPLTTTQQRQLLRMLVRILIQSEI